MAAQVSTASLEGLARTARTHAIAGAIAGVAVGVIHGIASARRGHFNDRYDLAAEGLTYVGTGAVLGATAATATALAGLSVAAVGGRGIAVIAVPLVASTVATSRMHGPVERLVRSWSEEIVAGLKRTIER